MKSISTILVLAMILISSCSPKPQTAEKSDEALKQLALDGLGVVLVTDWLVTEELEDTTTNQLGMRRSDRVTEQWVGI